MLVRWLDRYIFRQLLVAFLVTTGGLVALIWLTQSLRFLKLVVNRGLSLRIFVELTALLIPGFAAVIVPITTFIVVLFLYQRLAQDRELVIMRGAGLSNFALARPALALVVLVVGLGYWLNLQVVPASLSAFHQYRFEISNRIAAFLLQEGVFTNLSDHLTVYVRKRDPDGVLHGILLYDGRNPAAPATILAENGQLRDGPDGPEVLLFHGSRQVIDRQTGRLNVLTFAENTIDLAKVNHSSGQPLQDASELPLHALLHPNPATVSARDRGKFRVEAYRRLTSPLTTFSFALVGLTAALTGGFRRYGGIWRPAVGISAVVGLLAMQLGIADVAVRHSALISLMGIEAALPGVVLAWHLFGRFSRALRLPEREPHPF